MNSASIKTSTNNPLQQLPPNQQSCKICRTPWGFPKSLKNRPSEHPVLLPCNCIAGSVCLELSFQQTPRCPLCHTTIRIIPGVNAPLDPRRTGSLDELRHLELRIGIIDWPIPSIEHTPPDRAAMKKAARLRGKMVVRNGVLDWVGSPIEYMPVDGDGVKRVERSNEELWSDLDAVNMIHKTFLSVRDLQICISLIDWRFGITTTTSTIDVLNAFFAFGLFDWDERAKRWEGLDAYMAGPSAVFENGRRNAAADVRDVLVLINMRAGTSLLLNEVELVLSWMNHVHHRDVGVLDILGLRDENEGQQQQRFLSGEARGVVDGELVKAFGTLDVRVGGKNAVEDLGDVFEQASL